MRGTLLIASSMLACTSVPAGDAPLVERQRIELPHVDGRIDHLAWDAKSGRLAVAALGNGSIEIVEPGTVADGATPPAGRVLHRLTGLSEPQGVVWLPASGELAFTTGGDGKLHVHDSTTWKEKACLDVGGDADNVRLDADAGLLWIGCEEGLAIVDVKSWTKVGGVKLAGHAESFQLEPSGARLFVNVPSAQHVAVVDRAARKVVATWPLGDAGGNYPLALDAAAGRLYVGCREPACLLVLDAAGGARLAKVAIGGDTDDLFVDAARRRLHVACGGGEITSFAIDADGALARLPATKTAAGARTALLATERGALFVAVPHRGAQRAALLELIVR